MLKVSGYNNSTSFKAIPISQWRCVSAAENKPANIVITQLEKRDVEFINNFRSSWLVHPESKDSTRNSIVETALGIIEAALSTDMQALDKVKMFFALHNKKPCGVLIGNLPKKDASTGGINYSSRHNCAKKEGEIDWLATWTPKGEEEIKGTGKALVGEYFGSLNQDRLKDVFVKSELPELSVAQSFYESLGFETLGKKRTRLITNTSREYVLSSIIDPDDRVIPMIITESKIQNCFKELSQKMSRKEYLQVSLPTEDLINIDY